MVRAASSTVVTPSCTSWMHQDAPDFLPTGRIGNGTPQGVVDNEDLEHGGASAIAGVEAHGAALAAVVSHAVACMQANGF